MSKHRKKRRYKSLKLSAQLGIKDESVESPTMETMSPQIVRTNGSISLYMKNSFSSLKRKFKFGSQKPPLANASMIV